MKNTDESSRRNFMKQFVASSLAMGVVGHSEAISRTDESAGMRGALTDFEQKFVPVMLTPYTKDLKIDFAGLAAITDFYIASGAKGLFANCLSSEMYELSDEERLAVVGSVVKQANGRLPVVATGSFGKTTEQRAEFTRKMFDTGINGAILITSHFAEKHEPDEVMIRNLEAFLNLTGNIPLGTYECPSPYKRIMSLQVLRYLLDTRRLIYHKDTSIDLAVIKSKLDIAAKTKLEFYDAHTPNAMYSLGMGATGMSCIAGNFYPEIIAWMCAHSTDPRRAEDVTWIQSELTRADAIISKGYSLSAKYFLQKRGLNIEINSRKTKTPLTKGQTAVLDNIYKDLAQWRERLGIAEP